MRTDSAEDETSSRYFVMSIAKAFRVLEAFSEGHERLTLSELATRSGENKATVRRIALTLCDLRYLRQDASRKFSLSSKILDIGAYFLKSLSLPDIAEPYLTELTETVRESANLAIREGNEVLYILRIVASQRILTNNLHVGSRLPVHATSLGKALLVGLERKQLVEIIGNPPWPSYTNATRTDPDQLLADLQEAEHLGCVMANGELEPGLRSLAAPIRDAGGTIVAAVNVSTHSLRVPLDQLLGPMREELLRTSLAISRALGYRG